MCAVTTPGPRSPILTAGRCSSCCANRPRPVGELVALTGLTQPGTSKHLRVLRDAGLVSLAGPRRSGASTRSTCARWRARTPGSSPTGRSGSAASTRSNGTSTERKPEPGGLTDVRRLRHDRRHADAHLRTPAVAPGGPSCGRRSPARTSSGTGSLSKVVVDELSAGRGAELRVRGHAARCLRRP